MILLPFYLKFPEIAAQETRCITTVNHPTLPDGHFAFTESFCPDFACNCKKVTIMVMDDATKKPVASINYGWASPSFYRKWGLPKTDAQMLTRGFIDPMGCNTDLAPELLKTFRLIIRSDKLYVARLKKHYKLYKDSLTPNDTTEKALDDWKTSMAKLGVSTIY